MTARMALAVAVLALAATPAAATEPPTVWIDSPTSLTPAIGEVDVVVSVVSEEEVATVEIFVDGESKGILVRAPYRVRLDTGPENESHVFRIVARTVSGLEGARELTTPTFQVDDALDLELQQLYVTVTSNGRRRLDLARLLRHAAPAPPGQGRHSLRAARAACP